MERFLFMLKKFIPRPVFDFFQPAYHWCLAMLSALWYRFPSREMKVVGITGTSGKTTTAEMLFRIFSEAGFKTATSNGLYFRILGASEPNLLKMTTPGRFRIQKFLRDAKRAGCEYVFLEITSEGIKQHRHKFIKFYATIFTNLSEEHLEAHGGFENYRRAKARLFYAAPLHVLNGDDPNYGFFAALPAQEKIVFRENDWPRDLNLKIPGDFNKMNALAALFFARHEKIPDDVSKKALSNMEVLPGRMEFLETGKGFRVLVDYAFLPQTLKLAYGEAKKKSSGLVCVLGATGGGRDKWKRPITGNVAAEYCRKVFVTNEDPYDEDPLEIMNQVAGSHNFEKIPDRREAIRAALKTAKPGECVVITGKGAEPWIMGPGGTKIPWDDRRVVREELAKL